MKVYNLARVLPQDFFKLNFVQVFIFVRQDYFAF